MWSNSDTQNKKSRRRRGKKDRIGVPVPAVIITHLCIFFYSHFLFYFFIFRQTIRDATEYTEYSFTIYIVQLSVCAVAYVCAHLFIVMLRSVRSVKWRHFCFCLLLSVLAVVGFVSISECDDVDSDRYHALWSILNVNVGFVFDFIPFILSVCCALPRALFRAIALHAICSIQRLSHTICDNNFIIIIFFCSTIRTRPVRVCRC